MMPFQLGPYWLHEVTIGIANAFVISSAQARDETTARAIAADMALASFASGACSTVMPIDQDELLLWSKVMLVAMDNDVEATKAMTEPIIAETPKSAAGTVAKVGWAQFCSSIWLGYRDDGFQRRGLVRKVP